MVLIFVCNFVNYGWTSNDIYNFVLQLEENPGLKEIKHRSWLHQYYTYVEMCNAALWTL